MPISSHGRSASKILNRSWQDQSGMSLIEIMIAMTIVGLMFAVSVTGLRSMFDVGLKNASNSIAATLRHLSNKAVTQNLYIRVVYDLEKNDYYFEESQEPLLVESKESEEDTQEEEEKEEAAGGEKQKVSKLPSGVFFKDIVTSYAADKIERGKAYTYFFPDGFATSTLINLRNEEDEDHYSIELLSLAGSVTIEGEYREALKETPK